MWHFDTPNYIEEELGGWENRDTIALFDKYAKTILTEYKGLVRNWLTFNEINNTIAFIEMATPPTSSTSAPTSTCTTSSWPRRTPPSRWRTRSTPAYKVGCMICGIANYPLTPDPDDILANRYKWEKNIFYWRDVQCKGKYPTFATRLWNEHNVHLDITEQDLKDLAEGPVDFYTFSYYMSNAVTTHKTEDKAGGNFVMGAKNPYLTYSDWAGRSSSRACATTSSSSMTATRSRSWWLRTAWAPSTSSLRARTHADRARRLPYRLPARARQGDGGRHRRRRGPHRLHHLGLHRPRFGRHR